MQRSILVLVGAGLATSPSALLAADKQPQISASVPEVCRLDAPSLLLDANTGIASGTAFEACNSRRSYHIVAETRPLNGDEVLELGYGQDTLGLDADGSTIIKRSSGPVLQIVDLRLRAIALTQPVSLTLAMSAV